MRAQDLHQTAVFLRERFTPPDPRMTPGMYVSHEAMHALADALDRTGDVVAETTVAEVATTLPPDDAYLRGHALEQAVKAGLGFGGADDLARATATLVAYLRDGKTQPDPNLGTAKVDEPSLPGQPGAPAALHEAIDRAWRSIRDEGDRQVMDEADDEDVLEQVRQLADDEVARTGFTLAIVRSLSMIVRADRHSVAAAAVEGDAEAERER